MLTSAVVMVAFTSPLTAAMMSSKTLLILLSSFKRLFSASTSASADAQCSQGLLTMLARSDEPFVARSRYQCDPSMSRRWAGIVSG